MNELLKLLNIGKVLAKQLKLAGISTPEELMDAGSREAWLKIKALDPSACYNRLCALEGAICGIRWHNLPDDVKASLREFYTAHRTV